MWPVKVKLAAQDSWMIPCILFNLTWLPSTLANLVLFFLQLIIPSSFWLIAGRMKMSSWLTGSALKQHVVASHRHASFTQSAVAAATPLGHQERHLLITQLSKTFLRAKSCCSFCFLPPKAAAAFAATQLVHMWFYISVWIWKKRIRSSNPNFVLLACSNAS